MKTTTDPTTGVTSLVLTTADRKTLARAKSLLVEVAFVADDTDTGESCLDAAKLIGNLLKTSKDGEQ